MPFENLPTLPIHSSSDLEGDHDVTDAPDATPTPDLAGGGAEAQKQESSPRIPDMSKFDLTVGEALEAFQMENRKIPSARMLQRYCQDGQIDCCKLKTTRNGNPAHEWVIDSTSLWEFIQSCPRDEKHFTMATPEPSGEAKVDAEIRSGGDQPACVATASDRSGDAVKSANSSKTSEREPNVVAAPVDADDSRGGQRSRAELLIENARLTAQLDAQSQLVSELRKNKRYMREEIAKLRNNDRLLADIHRKTLETWKAVTDAGRHANLKLPRDQRPEEGIGCAGILPTGNKTTR